MKMVVLDGFTLNPDGSNAWDEVAACGELVVYDRTSPEEVVARAIDADIVLTNKTPLSAEILGALPSLKLISVLATGYNVVDTAAARRRGIAVSNVPVYGTHAVSQYVMALVLELCHHVQRHSDAVKTGRWSAGPDWTFWDYPLMELAGKTMGIVGFGRIGRQTAKLAHAFGMKVIAADVVQSAPCGFPVDWKSIPEVFSEADVVSLHCPLTVENTGMVNKELLSRMKKSAFLINTSRGPLVNEEDLAGVLNRGEIAGAACDVVSTEPILPDNPLLRAKNMILTPHIAWATREARIRLMKQTADNIKAFQSGEPINVVNKEG